MPLPTSADAPPPQIRRGQRVAVTQQIPQRQRVWTTRVEGTVLDLGQRPTGSWYAHGRHGRLWLDRLTLRKDDGEQVVCVLDQYSHIEIIREAAADAATEPSGDADADAENDDGGAAD